jgi:hypothetical protein
LLLSFNSTTHLIQPNSFSEHEPDNERLQPPERNPDESWLKQLSESQKKPADAPEAEKKPGTVPYARPQWLKKLITGIWRSKRTHI